MSPTPSIADRLHGVQDRIVTAAARAGREPADIRLVVVTKEVGPDRVREVVTAGATDLGENRVQDLTTKIESLAGTSLDPRWHFIGTLQRNKARHVAGRVALIHSVDSVALGRAIGKHASAEGVVQDALVEVNTSAEASKHGFAVAEVAPALSDLTAVPGLRIRGLMTIAPPGGSEAARACFRALRELREGLAIAGAPGVTELSMGMTDDFELAVEEGATMVRVGTAIFGPRA